MIPHCARMSSVKLLLVFFSFRLVSYVCVHASDMALYTGHPNPEWYAEATMLEDVEKIIDGVKENFKEIKSFDDEALNDLKAWAEANMDDGELDIIWLNGCMPSVLYPNPNKEPDGSLAEEWLNHGNMFINVADWFGYCTYETGQRGIENGVAGAENILNLPGIIRFGDNTNMKITDAGKKYLSSLGDSMVTDRPIVGGAVRTPWEVAEVFGGAEAADMDPCAIHNTNTDGYVAFINQATVGNSVDRAQVTIEFINNWVARKIGFIPTKFVEPRGKLTVLWGAVKR